MTVPAFILECRNRCGEAVLVPAACVRAVLDLIRFGGFRLLAHDVLGAAAGGSDEGIDDFVHVRLLNCTANNGGAYDYNCYVTVI